ncbi:hypothetical protein GCM10012275_39440 [Longimycelium tulufanense]|uniref:HTH cro/C1-type domain-containing protein n=1 Tax=Longimycelium tulufanense TaxID=907463 RepID=A0A8J3FV51_9PSEU|nr:helix-turn-helix transcriptional regulator [Longimycelium tulufanense]GGM65020.1 hypothetical protein GCM10012275_39440 [Longimycelium tulufanense]
MDRNGWWTWLQAQLDERGWTRADLARAATVSQSRIADWKDKGTRPTLDNARAVAHALQVPLLVVLVEAGLLTSEEARQRTTRRGSLADFTFRELLRELERRYTETTQRVTSGAVSHVTPKSVTSLARVADNPIGEKLRDQQERVWVSEAELPDPEGPDDGA